ncbi:MTH1187 family thiamine-binding protein [Corynebacterium uropygiale]|uniref:MTH1187 family thiamine-binding protein n=1 Tax=Corynebacterium uropygiale TaxID=1775911 RepID=A0A9X1QSG0_9CORY|nr:MTH1187 family thiamine-binding protein [Corynebacterium uropygiale]MCF4006968.1 MTH1187 family thiamine-binding protein [Corynebacterium uropygiale]
MIVAFCVAPTQTPTADAEMSAAVARAVKIVRESGLPHETNAMFTNIEGEWDEVMDVIRRATEAVMEVSPRVSLVLKADIRPGYSGQITQKVESLEARLRENEK